jgi:Metallo-peptidase family M12B Reprolysin-like
MQRRIVGSWALGLVVIGLAGAARAEDPVGGTGRELWELVEGKPTASSPSGATFAVRAGRARTYRLDREGMVARLATATEEQARVALERRLVLAVPAPDGTFARFAVHESPVMEQGLAVKHPDIKTYSGRGLDSPAATIRLDLTPLGLHASVRGPEGAWYIDPYYHLDQSLYASYFRRDVPTTEYPLVEPEPAATELAGDEAIRSALDTGMELAAGDQLRTYRLALISDPAYATYFGGPANVTAAKVTLVNRVTQIYEDDTAIRLVLVSNNDLLNLDTPALATGANGPCGTAACFTAAQVTSCGSLGRIRTVIGQIIGASNYDIGHLALGGPGGGLASLGVVGQSGKAQGCTGVTTPEGHFFAVDYVAHEMGHQFAGSHTFNGSQSSCSGGNRSSANSVEPGSGSSIMAYAGICSTDNLQPHRDPYWSQRSFQQIVSYTSANQGPINEVQTVSLRSFDENGDSFRIRYNGVDSIPIVRGTNYTAIDIANAIQGIASWPGGAVSVANFGGGGIPTADGFQVTFNNGPLAGTNVSALSLTNLVGATGFVGETDKGGPVDNKGTVTPTFNSVPVVSVPATFTIPLRTPFALTGIATDADGDALTYLWEQNDRGGTSGTALTNNAKVDGPLFRQFGFFANVTSTGTLLYHSPGENAVTTNPTRVFPDLAQILANNTNAESGTCRNVDCFSEFLPTASYVGFAGVNASPLSLHFRLTARDGSPGGGGVNSADTTLLLANKAGPFLVSYPNTAMTWTGNTSQAVTWDVANTNASPVSATDVAILLSVDGGLTYPHVLAAITPNDGSESISVPNVRTTQARVMVAALDNVFFDVSNADFTIQGGFPPPVVTNDAPVATSPPLPRPNP